MHFGRLCRKQLPCFTVLVSNQDNTLSETIVNVVEDGRMEPSRLQRLLDKHKSVFEPIKGLPPDRGVGHMIPLQPGSEATLLFALQTQSCGD